MCYVLFVSSCIMYISIKIYFVEFVVVLQILIKIKKKIKNKIGYQYVGYNVQEMGFFVR